MSTAAEKSPRAPSDRRRPTNNRRRKPASRGPRKSADETDAKPAAESTPREPRPPRPPTAPLPDSYLNKTVVGTVNNVVRRGKYNFGFIALGEGEDAPLIYFNPSGLVDNKLYLRRGFEVELVCAKDEEGRFTAKDIKLTAAGEKTKTERDAEYAAKKAERVAAAPAAAAATVTEEKEGAKRERGRRPRREPAQGTPLTLRVTCQGKAEEKTVEVHNLINIGRLKGMAIKAVEAEGDFNVYHIPSNGSDMVFLTREILVSLSNNDKIHLAAPQEKESA